MSKLKNIEIPQFVKEFSDKQICLICKNFVSLDYKGIIIGEIPFCWGNCKCDCFETEISWPNDEAKLIYYKYSFVYNMVHYKIETFLAYLNYPSHMEISNGNNSIQTKLNAIDLSDFNFKKISSKIDKLLLLK